jgi:hypothetical protein
MQWLYLDEDFIINSCDEIWAHIYLSLHLQQISLLVKGIMMGTEIHNLHLVKPLLQKMILVQDSLPVNI